MTDLNFQDMLAMQRTLWEQNRDKWSPLEPSYARNHFLWMIGELGEVLDIVKKCGEDRIMNDANIKAAFTEELCDVLMYFNNILLRYDISPSDIAAAYIKKHHKNTGRDFTAEQNKFAEKMNDTRDGQ